MNRWIIAGVLAVAQWTMADALPAVRTMRVPDGGIQPQVVARGDVVHLLYFTGDPKADDVQYARSTDGGHTFGKPIRVNSEPASAIAVGTIRGPRMAVGKNGRVHVAWMGSQRATPRAPGNEVPMLYARLNEAGDAFEPQRNVIAAHPGLDGGGTVAADEGGNVYVIWHAPEKPGDHDEQNRAVWVAHSTDDGKTFAAEVRANELGAGVCACCGLEASAVEGGGLYALYRCATERVHRDMRLIRLDAQLKPRRREEVMSPLNIGTCVMSTASLAQTPVGRLAAWEGNGEVFYVPLDRAQSRPTPRQSPPGQGKNRKHPRLVTNDAGQTLLAWTEDTSWGKGGSVAWQRLNERFQPIGPIGRSDGLPAWGSVAAFAAPDGTFTVLY